MKASARTVRLIGLFVLAMGAALPLTASAAGQIGADPNPVVFYPSDVAKTTSISWSAGPQDLPLSVYYKTNGSNETQFAPDSPQTSGTKDAAFIKLNDSYEFCLWGNGKSNKLACVTVTTKSAAFQISADPNPVVFYHATSKPKVTTISWSAGPQDLPLSVYYKTNGSNEAQFVPSSSQTSGTKDADFIKLNNSYEFCLWGNSKLNKLKCLTVTTKKVDVKLDLGIIDDVKVEPHGNFANVSFTTKVSTVPPIVVVSKKPPINFRPISTDDDQALFKEENVEYATFATKGSVHTTQLRELEPNTDFHFVIGVPHQGFWHRAKGKFHTLRRSVAVTLSKVKVVDDSDDLSDGDFGFGLFANGKLVVDVSAELGTGESKTFNKSATILNAPDTLPLKVVGFDNDETDWVPVGPFIAILLNKCGTLPAGSATDGDNDCGEWTSASGAINVDPSAATGSDPENFSGSTVLKARPKGDDSEVAFDATVNFSVSHVK